ncbi:MAG: hypothetical protein CMN85_10785 [Spongiibacteraceae bacterium]|uniref:hypothetical protein n=1 Tax=uncultured Haliea sp. TaxID=622616 RepID=UPI000C4331B6|nr:hypothetical protein [Spongiibacteraceae bacterium]|tara:strand:+ start:11819 stop:12328 length:510 start_codon:yes stop_codon:yes gene_type:complete
MNIKLIAASALIAFIAAWQVQAWRYGGAIEKIAHAHTEALRQAESDARKAEKELSSVTAEIDRLSEQARENVRVVTETVEKEVIRYVETDPSAGDCQLSLGWVRAHDNATHAEMPQNPAPSGAPDDAAGPATDVDALRAVSRNYRTCVGELQRLSGLQAYVEQVCLVER